MNLLRYDIVVVLDGLFAKMFLTYFYAIPPSFAVSHEPDIVIPAHPEEGTLEIVEEYMFTDPLLSHSFWMGYSGRSEYILARLSNSSTASSNLFTTTFDPSVRKAWAEDLIRLTVILLAPFNVDIGDVVGWKIEHIPNKGHWLWSRRIG